MLQLILGILKVIGWILLAVIALLLLAVLSLLFVPVRYRLAGRKEGEILEAHAGVSWLLHLAGVAVDYDKSGLVIRIKLFGITIKRIGGDEPEKKPGSRGKRRKKKKPGGRRTKGKNRKKSGAGTGTERGKKSEAETKTEHGKKSEPGTGTEQRVKSEPETGTERGKKSETELKSENGKELETGVALTEADRKQIRQSETGTVNRAEHSGKTEHREEALQESSAGSKQAKLSENIVSRKPVETESDYPETGDETSGKEVSEKSHSRIREVFGRIRETLRSFREKLCGLCRRIREAYASGKDAVERVTRMKQEMERSVRPFLTDGAKELYGRIRKHLTYLWKCYRPRKISGWCRFGTGAPDLTGELTGLIYLLLPVSAERLELIPDFTEAVLEADVQIIGHVRACHLVKVAILLWRDKELRKLIRRIRAKGGK